MTILKVDTVSGIGTEGTVFEGDITFDSLNYMTLPKGTTTQSNRGRGIFGGGHDGSNALNAIQYILIQSSGNAIEFGDLTSTRWLTVAVSSSTRGLFMGGGAPTRVNTIDYITIATTGNATDFGDLNNAVAYAAGCASQTRGIHAGGNTGPAGEVDVIEYVTIASAGNATDFGNLLSAQSEISGCSSPTRGIIMGGNAGAPNNVRQNVIQYITIATTGNATDFGDLTRVAAHGAACSSNTRGIYAGGYGAASPTNTYSNIIEFITIATTGNATDFGDLITARVSWDGTSNNSRGILGGGYTPSNVNTIEYITIANTGNATDFGDLLQGQRSSEATSDSHGGLSE